MSATACTCFAAEFPSVPAIGQARNCVRESTCTPTLVASKMARVTRPRSRHGPHKIAVIGAGIGGLAAALALLQRGLDVDVYEQAPELGEVGAGIQISPNGTRVLYALGLEDALRRVEVLPSRRQIRHWSTGETWDWFELGATTRNRYGTPHVMLHRADLHGLLAGAVLRLKPDAVHLAKRCTGVAQSDGQAQVRFETGETVNAAYVIGADGIHSNVRESL